MGTMKQYGRIKNGLKQCYCKADEFYKVIDIHFSDAGAPEGMFEIVHVNSKPSQIQIGQHLNYKYVQNDTIILKEYIVVEDGVDLQQLSVKDYENAVQDFLNYKVQERGYDNVYTCLSYKDDPYPKFANEAKAVLNWRSAVWLTAQDILNKWQANEIEQPTIQEVLDQLPALEW